MIAVVFATRQEARPLLASLRMRPAKGELADACLTEDGNGIVAICGMGGAAAGAAVRALLDRYPVTEVINAGAAGSLTHAAGHTVHRISTACNGDADADAGVVRCASSRFSGLPEATLASVSEPVFDAGRRTRLGARAMLVDMEGFAIASACRDRGVPCSVIKGVTDRADEDGRNTLRTNLPAVCAALADAIVAELGWPRREGGLARTFARFVRIEHTVFSIPLILAGAWLGAGHAMPSLRDILLLALVGTGARTMGMALNRAFDRDLDALNPRTRDRELPSGRIGLRGAYAIAAVGLVLYLAGCAALRPICLYLSPVPLIPLIVYSLLKRFTSLCHFGIGLCLALGPAGAFVATSGELPFRPEILLLSLFTFAWVSGFDVIYALQDLASDRVHGVHSLPARIGSRGAQVAAAFVHLVAAACVAALWSRLGSHALSAVCMLITFGALAAAYWPAIPLPVRFFPVSSIAGIGGALVVLLGGLP